MKKIYVDSKKYRGFLPYVDAVIKAGTQSTLCSGAIEKIMIRLINRHDGKDSCGKWKQPENQLRYNALVKLRIEKRLLEIEERKAKNPQHEEDIKDLKKMLDNTTFEKITKRFKRPNPFKD